MTIEKGRPWGEPGALPEDGPVAHSDEALRAIVERCRRAGQRIPTVGLLGGDLHRTLGGTGNNEARLRSGDAVVFPIDVGVAQIDGETHWFVAHLIARRRLWTRTWAAFNAQWYEKLNLAPRAHPNDGLLDILDARLRVGDLAKVARRARLGSHLPHPGIATQRVAEVEVELDRPAHVILDGSLVARTGLLRVAVEPDALHVVI